VNYLFINIYLINKLKYIFRNKKMIKYIDALIFLLNKSYFLFTI